MIFLCVLHILSGVIQMINSLWADTTALPEFPALDHDLKTDVLIVGGGMVGLLCAYALEQAGVDYALIEADRICGAVTKNTTAKITAQHGLIYSKLIRQFGSDAARQYWEANENAIAQIARLAETISCEFERKDAYLYESVGQGKLETEFQALEQLRISVEYLDHVPLPFPTAGGIRFQGQAQFHPLKFAAGIAQGLHIFERTAALEFLGTTVRTANGAIRSGKIIVATHFPMLNKHGSYFLKLYQHRSYVLGLANGPALDGMFLDVSEAGLSLRSSGDVLMLGGGAHRTGKQGGGWTALEAYAHRYFPTLPIAYRWATQDCMSLDGVPYIGPYSRRTPNLYVATGFNKWGMTTSMVAANLLTDLVQGKENPYAEMFSPSRNMLRPQLLVNGLEATKNLLTPTRPRCPHMGCALKWNPQERSWDCPCHGSRFAKDGSLLDNPATGGLKR